MLRPLFSKVTFLSQNVIYLLRLDFTTVDLSSFFPNLFFLTKEESAYFHSLHVDFIQQRYLVSRYILKQLLSFYLNCDIKDLCIKRGVSGKPYLDGPIFFNLSHSGNYLFFGISKNSQVGVDIQICSRSKNISLLVKRFFSLDDQYYFESLRESERQDWFCRSWVFKEAYTKYYGDSLLYLLKKLITPPYKNNKVIHFSDDLFCYWDDSLVEYQSCVVGQRSEELTIQLLDI